MRSRVGALVVAMLVAVLVLLTAPAVEATAVASAESPTTHAYADQHCSALVGSDVSERGPPADAAPASRYDADDCWSYGVSARPSSTATRATCAYGGSALRAQVDGSAGTTSGPAEARIGDLSSHQGSQVAANAGRETTILGENMGQRVMPFAEGTGARHLGFGATADEWAAMTPRQRWKLNDGMLRARINEGDSFRYIGRDADRPPSVRAGFDLTGSELLRLNSRGIPYDIVSPAEVFKILGRY